MLQNAGETDSDADELEARLICFIYPMLVFIAINSLTGSSALGYCSTPSRMWRNFLLFNIK